MGLELDWDIVDKITLQSLENHHKINKEILDNYYHNGKWLHRDDLEDTSLMIYHLKAVIEYYGGSVDSGS
jgi:hypothetical protein